MKIIERTILKDTLLWLKKREIIVITGSRQVGKTTLLKLILEVARNEPSVYFDLEDLNILEICNKGPESFINYLKLLGHSLSERLIVALDEVQYLKNPSNFLKIIHDHYPTLKLIVSGSSTLEIRQKFKDSLAGRKVVFELDTLSFEEFLLLRSGEPPVIKKNIGNILTILDGDFDPAIGLAENKLNPFLFEYLTFGGYPKPAQEDSFKVRTTLIGDIYNSYVRKDIKDIARIEDVFAFNNLLKILSSQIGNLVNIREISSTLGINILTAKKYLFLLENTFIVSFLTPFFRNKRKEISKMPKVYFLDIGLRNTAVSNFQSFEERVDRGAIFENYVFCELKKRLKLNEEIFYWRSISKAEVDLVIFYGGEVIPVEVKAQRLSTSRISRSLGSFIDSYKPKRAIVINLSLTQASTRGGCEIFFVPAYAI
jgi:predicted AAA+ superfamily ATPase